jgi:hypothetical protein
VTGVRASGSGNRAFWRMVTVSVALRVLLAYGICCLALAIFDAVRSRGAAALWSNDPNLVPGLVLLAAVAVGVTRAPGSSAVRHGTLSLSDVRSATGPRDLRRAQAPGGNHRGPGRHALRC